MIKLKFPDGSEEEFRAGVSPKEICEKLPKRIAKNAICAKVNGKLIDINAKIEESGNFEIISFDSEDGKRVFWHTSSHILAQAIKRIFPEAKLAIGPAIEQGFYYDFDNLKIGEEDIKRIEEEAKKVIGENLSLKKEVISKEDAKKIFINEPYKLQIIDEIEEETVSIYKQGDFVDLCRGPHLESTGKVKAFKIIKLAGAYWKGNSSNKMLTRIYGISFPKESELKAYLDLLEEAKRRDHKKLGKQLELFDIKDEGPGFPFFYPNGMIIWNELMAFWRNEHRKAGYSEVKTPIILSKDLWVRSGHWSHYRSNMYITTIDNAEYAIKPMNCPGGILIYNSKKHSYKELPIRMGELGLVHRNEMSGVLNGLFRVRSFHQDDAHIFCTPEQIESEVIGVLELVDKIYRTFGFSYSIELSTMPEDHIGAEETWEIATKKLMSALEKKKIEYKINEGDGAFYGPKIDFHIKDSLGREWQCATIQVDFALPERFELTYMGEDGTENHRPIMIHRTVFGSLERFIGILIEHYAGKFPLWFAPTQAIVLSISDESANYASEIGKRLVEEGIRCKVDNRNESIGKKIREAQIKKIKYVLVVGKQEVEAKSINVRNSYENKIIGSKKIDELIRELKKEIEEKR